MSTRYPWYTYKEGDNFSSVSFYSLDIDEIANLYEQTDPISEYISFDFLITLVSNSPLLVLKNSDSREEGNLNYQVQSLESKQCNMITLEKIIKIWGIEINTARRTLTATMHQFIWYTGFLSQHFHTDKSQLQYKINVEG